MTTATAPAPTRLYLVTEKVPASEDAPAHDKPAALILAKTPAGALKHFTASKYSVKYAEQMDMLAAVEAGIKPQAASVDAE